MQACTSVFQVRRLALILAFVFCAQLAAAQAVVDTITQSSGDVSLRDYTSARIDHIEKILDERDRRYAQRFEAQQQALNAALQAAKEGTANALAAAKEAVNKAEEASNKRFDSVNEFRQTLTDQSTTFMSKPEANARLKSLEDDVTRISARNEGANNLWAYIAGAILLVISIGGFALNVAKRKESS